jgi:hypothetical protein
MLLVGLCATATPRFRQELDFAVVEPDTMGQQHMLGIEQAESIESVNRTDAITAVHLLQLNFGFIGVSVETGPKFLRQIDRAPMALFRRIERVLQPDPDRHSAIGLAMPSLKKALSVVEMIEIVVIRMLTDIRRHNRAVTDRGGSARATVHKAPHVDDGSRA